MLVNADCFDVFPSIVDNAVDLVLVDPPYNQTKLEWDVGLDLDRLWAELKRICKHKALIIFFTTTRFGVTLINSNPKWFRYDLVWSKPSSNAGFQTANKKPMQRHEMIYVFADPTAIHKTYNPQKIAGTPYVNGGYECKSSTYGIIRAPPKKKNDGSRHPSSILEHNLTGEKRLHPTQKPLPLCEWLIKSFSNENDVVMDCTMGSGSTIIGALNTNRNFIGIEKDEEIFNVAMERIGVMPDTRHLLNPTLITEQIEAPSQTS